MECSNGKDYTSISKVLKITYWNVVCSIVMSILACHMSDRGSILDDSTKVKDIQGKTCLNNTQGNRCLALTSSRIFQNNTRFCRWQSRKLIWRMGRISNGRHVSSICVSKLESKLGSIWRMGRIFIWRHVSLACVSKLESKLGYANYSIILILSLYLLSYISIVSWTKKEFQANLSIRMEKVTLRFYDYGNYTWLCYNIIMVGILGYIHSNNVKLNDFFAILGHTRIAPPFLFEILDTFNKHWIHAFILRY